MFFSSFVDSNSLLFFNRQCDVARQPVGCTHEDVDGVFGNTSPYIRHLNVLTPDKVKKCHVFVPVTHFWLIECPYLSFVSSRRPFALLPSRSQSPLLSNTSMLSWTISRTTSRMLTPSCLGTVTGMNVESIYFVCATFRWCSRVGIVIVTRKVATISSPSNGARLLVSRRPVTSRSISHHPASLNFG